MCLTFGTRDFRVASMKLLKGVDPEGVFSKGGLCDGYFSINEKGKGKKEKVRDEL